MLFASLHVENGILETTQVVLLAGVGLLWLAFAIRRGTADSRWTAAAAFIAAVSLIGAARELSFGRVLQVSDGLVRVVELASALGLGLAIVVSVRRFFRMWPQRWGILTALQRDPIFGLLIGAVVWMILGSLAEHQLHATWHELLEEVCELIAYACVGMAAIVGLRTRTA